MAQPIEMPFAAWIRVGPKEPCVRQAGEGAIWGVGTPCDADFRQSSLSTCLYICGTVMCARYFLAVRQFCIRLATQSREALCDGGVLFFRDLFFCLQNFFGK